MAKLTIGDLMSIDASRQYKAQFCIVSLEKIYHEVKNETIPEKIKSFFLGKSSVSSYYLIFKLKVTSDSGKPHFVYIRTSPEYDINEVLSNKVEIYCDCSDFKYRAAYVLNQKKSLFLNDRIKIELGAALTDKPKTKTTTTYLCKHAYAGIQWLVSNYSKIMKTI
jgi:hypothetical protein